MPNVITIVIINFGIAEREGCRTSASLFYAAVGIKSLPSAASIFSINIPYPSVGFATITVRRRSAS